MKRLKPLALALAAVLGLSGCATVSDSMDSLRGMNGQAVRPVPKMSQPDTGLQLDMRSGTAMTRAVRSMIENLDRSEASVVATAMIVLTNYEGCKKHGYLTLDKANRDEGPKNLTPEDCRGNLGKLQRASFASRDHVLKWGRPDDDRYFRRRFIMTGEVVEGGTGDGDSWDSVIGYSDGALHGMTRTDLLTAYNALMGKKAMRPLPDWIEAIN